MKFRNPSVGDRGQRYEVRYIDRVSGEQKVMGWTNEPDGGALMKSAKLWPVARDPFVVDRQESSTSPRTPCERDVSR